METSDIISLIKESTFLLATFGVFLFYAMVKGRYALINILFALYLALLIFIKFPYFETIENQGSASILKILLFIGITIFGIVLFRRHIPGDDYEPAFSGFGKKILLAGMATILVMIFSFHALPISTIIETGTPIQSLFAPEQNFFWWLMLPLFSLFFV